MNLPVVRAFIQARMSSSRFPGKVLAPLNGRPIIEHVLSRVAEVIPAAQITVATSDEHADEPLVCYIRQVGYSVYRGPLDNVFKRFQLCLQEYPCDWLFRVCADSPLLDPELIKEMSRYSDRTDVDLITNTFPRSFPKGQSLELLKADTFAGVDSEHLTADQKEHLTKFYYDNPRNFRILNLESGDPTLALTNLCVDTIEDLHYLERVSSEADIVRSIRLIGCSMAR